MSGEEAPKRALTAFECVTPILRVQNFSASIDYYARVLGFKVDWQDPGTMASVSRDRCNISETREPGSGSASETSRRSLRSIATRKQGSGIHQRTTRGPARCRLRTSMEMCSDSAQSRSPINFLASGLT
jgi:hypothetical protein